MRFAAIAIATTGVLAAACGHGEKSSQAAQAAPVAARVARVDQIDVPQWVEVYGTTEADRQTAVSSRVMATVTAVAVTEGQLVAAGAVLVVIDPATARGQEAQARGALAQAEAAHSLASRNLQRFEALAAKGAASELELDMARMQAEQAAGAVEQAQGAVAAAASVARESQVVAPFAGRIVRRMVEAGDLAAPGRPLVVIESATGRRFALAVPESVVAASGLAIGATVPVRIDARPDLGEIAGIVAEKTPGADPMSHTFQVKIELPEVAVVSGAAGRARIATGGRTALVVPAGALLKVGGLDLVIVRDASGRARSRAVSPGATLPDGRVEVLAGVKAGDEVLVGLGAAPADGAPVEEVR
jgi:RND family efflux transporter MFP subunit